MIPITLVLSTPAEATLPTITKYGITPVYSDAGDSILYFLTYTDADNDSPSTGYPKANRFMTATWPAFTFIANDTSDVNYTDGKAYYYVWNFFPVVGVNLWYFKVKSGTDAEQNKLVTQNVAIPSKLSPYQIYPESNFAGDFMFTFNYTSAWGYTCVGLNLTIDGISYSMIENDTFDTGTYDGKMFHYNITLNASTHQFTMTWHDMSYVYPERTIGEHWMILIEEPDYNKIGVAGIITGLLIIAPMILFWNRKPKSG